MQNVLSIMQYQLFLISDPPSYRETVMTEKRELRHLEVREPKFHTWAGSL